MFEPDPKIVRKVARTAMELAATRRDDLDLAIRRHGGLGEMPEDPEAKAEYRKAYGALYSAAAADMKAGATVVVSWPDESQDDPFAMIAEDAPTDSARDVAEHWFSHAALIVDSVGGPEWHAIADMTRRILDLMDAEQDVDVQAVAALLWADDINDDDAFARILYTEVRPRFAGRVAELKARTAKAGES